VSGSEQHAGCRTRAGVSCVSNHPGWSHGPQGRGVEEAGQGHEAALRSRRHRADGAVPWRDGLGRGETILHSIPSVSQPLCLAVFYNVHSFSALTWGTGIRGLMRGMVTLPQGNQELLVVRDKVGRPPGELRVSKSMECDIFPSVL